MEQFTKKRKEKKKKKKKKNDLFDADIQSCNNYATTGTTTPKIRRGVKSLAERSRGFVPISTSKNRVE